MVSVAIISVGSCIILGYLAHVVIKVRDRKNIVKNNPKNFGLWEYQLLFIGGIFMVFPVVFIVIDLINDQDVSKSLAGLFGSGIGLFLFLIPFLSINKNEIKSE